MTKTATQNCMNCISDELCRQLQRAKTAAVAQQAAEISRKANVCMTCACVCARADGNMLNLLAV